MKSHTFEEILPHISYLVLIRPANVVLAHRLIFVEL